MAGKKDKSLIYWEMNYAGKLRRTWVMLPICIIVGVAAPFYTSMEYDSIAIGLVLDVILAVTWVAQFLYTKSKAAEEAAQKAQMQAQQAHATQQAPAQYAQQAPQNPNQAQTPFGGSTPNA